MCSLIHPKLSRINIWLGRYRYALNSVVRTTVDSVLMNLRGKAYELYSPLKPTVGPYVEAADKALGRLAANVGALAAEAAAKLTALSKEVPLGGGSTLHDILFGDQQAQV